MGKSGKLPTANDNTHDRRATARESPRSAWFDPASCLHEKTLHTLPLYNGPVFRPVTRGLRSYAPGLVPDNGLSRAYRRQNTRSQVQAINTRKLRA